MAAATLAVTGKSTMALMAAAVAVATSASIAAGRPHRDSSSADIERHRARRLHRATKGQGAFSGLPGGGFRRRQHPQLAEGIHLAVFFYHARQLAAAPGHFAG